MEGEQKTLPQEQVIQAQQPVEGEEDGYIETVPNPEGFFADTNDQSCSVKVAVRIRPFIGKELREGARRSIVDTAPHLDKLSIGSKEFVFDKVFDLETNQESLFDTCSRNLVLGCFSGYNATILAYGQTGSGKTHTMGTGSTVGLAAEHVGIVPRVFDFIFQEVENRRKLSEFSQFSVKVQFLELYNEELHDLLDTSSVDPKTGQQMKQLSIREEKGGSIRIEGLKAEEVQNKEQCLAYLNKGIGQRVTSATLMNEGSSRSHAIFTITIDQKIVKVIDVPPEEQESGVQAPSEPATSEEQISAKFHFVDLAGSERIKKTGATGKLMLEGISINKGLLALGNVISALTDEKKSAAGKAFIPYRDSKLTRILQDSLGGNSRTTMIACVSPAESNYDETLGTIKYASRARNIQNKPVVNRDPNSILIEGLQNKISQLEMEVLEYQKILKTNGIEVPDDLKETVQEKVAESKPTQPAPSRQSVVSAAATGGASASEVRDLKIKLARKEKELKEVQIELQHSKDQKNSSNSDYMALQKERDELVLRQEAIQEHMKKNNIEAPSSMNADPKVGGKRTSTLIDEYKAKLQKFQAEIEKKNQEVLQKSKKIAEMSTQMKRDEALLKKAIDEATRLKRDMKKPQVVQNVTQKLVVNVSKDAKKKGIGDVPDAETIKNQFMDKLTNQLESFFTDDQSEGVSDTTSMTTATSGDGAITPKLEELTEAEDKSATASLNEASKAHSLEDKQKLVAAVKQNVDQIKSDLGDLLKNTWASRITEIQSAMAKIEAEKRKNMSQQAENSAAAKAIEKEYKAKMDELSKQLVEQQRAKKKKEDSITKIMSQQETRIKAMENDLLKMKQKAADLEKQKKYGEERFSKFKTTATKDLQQTKRTVQEKDKAVSKLKQDLKKTDQIVQQKISELKGLQRKAREDKERRESEEIKENHSKGIDVDAIKDWINQNTQQLLKQQELNEFLKTQIQAKEEIEDEMLSEGDRLTELMVMKERLEYEQQAFMEADANGEEIDEARALEVEAELEDVVMESDSITQTLDTLDEHLAFVTEKINKLREEINTFDMDSIQPPRFKGLQSVDMARATLRTFFMVLLDLNVYKRDLESKCIEQDENILDLQQQVQLLRARSGAGLSQAQMEAQMRKERAMREMINSIGEGADFADQREMSGDVKLNKSEQAQLTKMSLSKIVSNLRTKLKEQDNRVQSLNLKLDSVIKEKEALKLKYLELQKQKKATAAPTIRTGSHSAVKSRINTGLSNTAVQAPAAQPTIAANQRRASHVIVSPSARRMSFKERRDLKKAEEAGGKKPSKFDFSDDATEKPKKKPQISTSSWRTDPTPSLQQRRQQKQQQEEDPNEQLRQELRQISQDISHGSQNNYADKREQRKQEMLNKAPQPKAQPDPSRLFADSQPETVDEAEEDDYYDEEPTPKKGKMALSVEDVDSKSESSDLSEAEENKDDAYSWKLQDVCNLPFPEGTKVINAHSHGQRLFVLYSNMTCVEVNIQTKEMVRQQNLLEMLEDKDSIATAFALFQDLTMIAVATPSSMFLFDYSDTAFQLVTEIKVAHVTQVIFIEVYLILVIDDEDATDATLACYQMDDDEPLAKIDIKKFLGARVLIRPGEESVFFATGTQLGSINVPDMELMYQEDTGHTQTIIDFVISKTCIFTTSLDQSLRVFDVEQGMLLIEPMEDMECDSLAVQGYHLVARCGNGQAMFVFKYEDGAEELEEIDFIECDDDDDEDTTQKNYLPMRGGLEVEIDGTTFNMILVAHVWQRKVYIQMLRNKQYLS